ncbi:hypothetical protein EDD85DRAFT_940921 [Armillaria nabsnona]|nr:hypothetical protein EDD85DRAFT_940921 [Armillaria nabsnona]
MLLLDSSCSHTWATGRDYEEIGHSLYGAPVFKAYCRVPVVYRLDSAVHLWLVGDDGPVPDRRSNVLDRVIPTLEWNPQMVEDCWEDSCGWCTSRQTPFCEVLPSPSEPENRTPSKVIYQSLCGGVMNDWDDEENDWDDDEENDSHGEEASDWDDDGKGLLDQLNTTLGTSYSLDNPFLPSLLDDCITNSYDFGMAYSHLRRIWHTDNWSTIQDELCRQEEKDGKERREAIVGNQIVDTDLLPRRVWDLYSNRVVPPYWIMDIDSKYLELPRPISHAWMDEEDRTVVLTPINGYEWPVPIPKDVDLNLIRIEMLNLGLECVWLDVLCLRQVGGPREDLRAEEWKLDVPTIGIVYEWANVVCYLSGLGRPLTLKEGELESDRSWFRRAWTLQEVGLSRVVAGDTPDGPLHTECKDGKYETELLTKFHKQLQSTHQMSYRVRDLLVEMRKRVSTNPVDKIAGLAFVMDSRRIPAYYESQSLEQAWTALVNTMTMGCRGPLFFLCAEPGNAGKKWRPSWDQVMAKPLPPFFGYILDVHWDEGEDEDWCNGKGIEGLVLGLAVVKEGDRRGVLIAKDRGGIDHRFEITASHTSPIPEDTYAMIYTCKFPGWQNSRVRGWVVGRNLPGRKFEKVSILIISREEHRRLENLGIIESRRYILI